MREKEQSRKRTKTRTKKHPNRDLALFNVDHVVTSATLAHFGCLYMFEDKAAIKMMLKCRSLAMRHVSTTHRVALDLLFDRINLDQQIEIKYVDTKNQLAAS